MNTLAECLETKHLMISGWGNFIGIYDSLCSITAKIIARLKEPEEVAFNRGHVENCVPRF